MEYRQFNSLIISGERQFDTGSNAWTTPDAYKGKIDDPASMERYMWNGNNPVAYNDPSGYCPICMVVAYEAGVAIVDGLAGTTTATSVAGGAGVVGTGIIANRLIGKAGEQMTESALRAYGTRILGKQIRVSTNVTVNGVTKKVTAVFDHAVDMAVEIGLVETKTGNAHLSANQKVVMDAIMNGGAFYEGNAATLAGLRNSVNGNTSAIIVRHLR